MVLTVRSIYSDNSLDSKFVVWDYTQQYIFRGVINGHRWT